MMTIGQFSERTGLSPKTLRYYEEVELLTPAVRLENGYRHYAEVQVERARLISSLRQAGVSVAAIRDFLESDQACKDAFLTRWREEAAAKLLSIQVANQFLNGLDSQTKHVHLTYWDQSRYIVWFSSDTGKRSEEWQNAAQAYRCQLLKIHLEVERSTYLRFDEGDASTHAQIGFVIQGRAGAAGQTAERYAPTLFATLECRANMPFPCRPIFSALRRFGFRSVGTPLRRYPDSAAFVEGRYLLMVPVVRY